MKPVSRGNCNAETASFLTVKKMQQIFSCPEMQAWVMPVELGIFFLTLW